MSRVRPTARNGEYDRHGFCSYCSDPIPKGRLDVCSDSCRRALSAFEARAKRVMPIAPRRIRTERGVLVVWWAKQPRRRTPKAKT